MRRKGYKKFGDLKSLPASQVEFTDNFDFTRNFYSLFSERHMDFASLRWLMINQCLDWDKSEKISRHNRKNVLWMHHSSLFLCQRLSFWIAIYGFKDTSGTVPARPTRESLREFLILSKREENLVWQRKKDARYQFIHSFNQKFLQQWDTDKV